MSKSNYTKVEEALKEGVYRMQVDAIISSSKPNEEKDSLHPAQMMLAIIQRLKWMKKQDPDIHKHIKIKKQEIIDLAEIVQKRRDSLKDSEVKQIKALLEKINKYKEEAFPPDDDNLYVEDERDRHLYKRHNVSEKWLPLDVPRD